MKDNNRNKISKIAKDRGVGKWNKGRKFTKQHKQNLGLSKLKNKNPMWKGNKVGIPSLHKWISTHLGKPTKCEHCGKDRLKGRQIHWSNKKHTYKRNLKELNISYLGINFKKWFDYKNVKPRKTKLYTKVLGRGMSNEDILKEFKPTEISLAELFAELKGLDKTYWYLAYIRNKNNALRAVRVAWYGGGWDVFAFSVENPVGWGAGYQVMSKASFKSNELTKTYSLPDELTINGVVYKKYEQN